jgi:signal transduction histidine kinase
MIDQERAAVSAMLHTSMLATVGFLGVTLLLMVLFGGYVVRTVVRPLDRFLDYVDRVSAGNYEVIQPVRPYRDEFSSLALAFNRMLGEIVTHQDQLVQSGKMAAVGTLTSGIAHELNNPLNNIGLTLEALLDDLDSYPPEEQRRMLGQAYTQVERASTTVRNLLDFTRKDRTAFTRVPVKSVVDTALRLVGNEAMIAGVETLTRVDPDVAVQGNPHDLQQVLVNLLLNAIQAMPEGGTIRVEAEADEEMVRIDVADTGEGISSEHVDEIFDPFFTTKEPGQGTGLGLSVSHSIIEQHGGRITVASTAGEGTTFTIRLPIATPNDTDAGMK